MIELRQPTTADVDDIARIYIDSWNDGYGHLIGVREHTSERRDQWAVDLADPDVAWTVAELDGVVAGFCGVGASRDPVQAGLGELQTIAVDSPFWRRGVGSALMAAALDQLRGDFESAILWTPSGYDRGHAFYEATGWTALGWSRDDDRHTAFAHRLTDSA